MIGLFVVIFFNGMNEQCILRNSQYISLVYVDLNKTKNNFQVHSPGYRKIFV